MKKLIIFTVLLLCIFAPAAYGAEKYPDINALFQHWETDGYPDYVGGVFSTDGGTTRLTVLLVGDDGSAAEQIRASLIDDGGLSFGSAVFSMGELKAVNDEIVEKFLGKADKLYSVGVGWTSSGGLVTGFGESGTEPRVVVSVDESVLQEYRDKFHALYGGIVVVEAGGPVTLAGKMIRGPETAAWQLPLLLAIIAGTLIIMLLVRARPVTAMQTAEGGVVSSPAPVGRREAISAVKNSRAVPDDGVRLALMKRVDGKQADTGDRQQ